MPLDIYSTAAQLKAIEFMPREYTFLYDTFVNDEGAVEDDKAIYDYRKGVRQMAPVVHPGAGGVVMERSGYETREIGFCTIAPERVIDTANLSRRLFGEQILGALTRKEREKKMLARDIAEMRRAIQRRREWMARRVLLTGVLDVFRYTSEGRDLETTLVANYGFTQTFTPGNAWNTSGATIDKDMRDVFDMVYEGLGYVDTIVMAPNVADAMLNNSAYVKQLDVRNMDMGEVNTKYRGQGVRFIGHNSDGVEMYSFAGKYIDDDGQVKSILPDGKVIVGSRGILKCLHGPVTQVETPGADAKHNTYIKPEVPLRYGSIESNAVKNRLTSRPTIVPYNVDGWAVINAI